MVDVKVKAKEIYYDLPLPKSKYTDLSWWDETSFPIEAQADLEVSHPDLIEVSENGIGHVVPVDTNKLIAYHYYQLSQVYRIKFPKGFVLKDPLLIRIRVKGRYHMHLVVEGEEGSRAQVVVVVEGSGLYTEVVEITSEENSFIRVGGLENMDDSSVVIVARGAVSHRNSKAQIVGAWFGGKFVMAKHHIRPLGEGSHIDDVQVLLGRGSQHFDLTTHLDFSAPHTKGESLIRAVLKDRARAVMYGMIDIQKRAQHADAYLSEHTLLLNSGARADSIPGLEIMANEVRATHGATVGPIDEEKVFYLMSRGMSRSEAKKLIVMGFFEPAFERMDIEELRKSAYDNVEAFMS